MNLIIQYEHGVNIKELVASLGGVVTYDYQIPGVFIVDAEIPDARATEIETMAGVIAVSKPTDKDLHTAEMSTSINLADYSRSWGVDHIRCPQVHAAGNTGQGIKLNIMDSGIAQHPDLKIAGGINYVTPGAPFEDDNSHGTHCAGIAAAQPNTGEGVTGVAYGVELWATKILNRSGSGSYANMLKAIEWSIQNKMQVVSMSLGGEGDPGEAVHAGFIAAEKAGIIMVAAAGNDGPSSDNVLYPARWDEVIAVGSTADRNNNMSSFTSQGPTLEVSAPGSSIYSTVLNNFYGFKSGTSMACPHVSGVMCLALKAGIQNPRALIETASIDLLTPGRDTRSGWGLTDAVNMTEGGEMPTYSRNIILDASESTDDGEIVEFTYDWGDGTANGGKQHPLPIPHAYEADGIFTVTVTLTDDGGKSAADAETIEVREAPGTNEPPVVKFTISNA